MESTETPVVTVMKELIKPDRIAETHISYVFLKDDYVYKVKKSVDFGFLDFGTKKKRKAMCILEKDLNERFCKDIYLDVLKIVRKEKSFDLVNYDSSLLTIDYCVKMKRINDGAFLSTKVANGEVTTGDAVRIGENIAKLFKGIKTDPYAAEANGSYDIVKFNCEENFAQTEGYKGGLINAAQFDFIKKQTMKFLEENKELFERRLKDGYVVDGHGDLRLEHIYMDGDEFGLIDCIEFNQRFRFNDIVSEIGFLSMEVDQMGRTEFSDGLLEGFFKVYDDEDSKKLLNFYRCYRAYVRAKVTCFLLSSKDESWEHYKKNRDDVTKLMDMATLYAANMFETKGFIFYGLMASGKTKNAKVFSEIFPVRHINTDVVRKVMHGINPESKVHVDFGVDIYSKENSLKLYDELGMMAEKNRRLGRMSVIDGSFSKTEYLDRVKGVYTGEFIKVRFFASEDEILRRLERRKNKICVTDGRIEIYESQKKTAQDIGADFEVETTGRTEDNALKILGFLINEA
jgi:aminoglycoside phosphotransferase family enzyme/predicted kinase